MVSLLSGAQSNDPARRLGHDARGHSTYRWEESRQMLRAGGGNHRVRQCPARSEPSPSRTVTDPGYVHRAPLDVGPESHQCTDSIEIEPEDADGSHVEQAKPERNTGSGGTASRNSRNSKCAK